MRISAHTTPTASVGQLDSQVVRVAAPLVLTAIAASILFVSVDFTDPVTVFRASMGVALLFAVFARQAGLILDLDRHATNRERQLNVMGDVVSALSTSEDIQSTLKHALERLTTGLKADAAAVWLPADDGTGRLTLAEQTGLPPGDFAARLLEDVRIALENDTVGARHHRVRFHRNAKSRAGAYCLSDKMGRRSEDFGYLTVLRWQGPFEEPDRAVVSTIASDMAGTIRSVRLIAEAQRLADCDAVTNVYNHRYLFQRLYSEVERHAATGKPLSLLMLDLDNFKLYNDTYGHLAGDEVLKKAANVLKRFFRDTDIIARYGGDEFMIVLPNASLENAVRCAHRLQCRFADEDFLGPARASVPIYVSCGVSNFPSDGTEVLELVAVADANLYEAKTQGQGKVNARTVDVMDGSFQHVEGLDLLRSLVIAVDNKDRYTRRHSEEVTAYALQIAHAMGLPESMLQTIHVCGLLHDLGKIGVPDRILRKPGALTVEESTVMNQHPVIGALIVGSIPGMEDVVPGVRNHHERYDGLGYPDGLAGRDIPLLARILAVADVYSAMTTHRPYRKALSRATALRQIEQELGTHFDPEIGRKFINILQAQTQPVGLFDEPPGLAGGTSRVTAGLPRL